MSGTAGETTELAHAAGLLGGLWLREIDAPMLGRLRSAEVRPALSALGLPVPEDGDLERLAVEYCAAVVGPAGHVPLVQSVYVGDGFESPAANAVRKLADAAGLTLDRGAARAAPPDHLGSILCLWSELAERWPEGAARLAEDHLSWARAPLAQLAQRPGFYGRLAEVTAAALDVVTPG